MVGIVFWIFIKLKCIFLFVQASAITRPCEISNLSLKQFENRHLEYTDHSITGFVEFFTDLQWKKNTSTRYVIYGY